jgi:hypothetical protein
MMDRQMIDRQLIDRQLIDRQLIDRQLINRRLIEFQKQTIDRPTIDQPTIDQPRQLIDPYNRLTSVPAKNFVQFNPKRTPKRTPFCRWSPGPDLFTSGIFLRPLLTQLATPILTLKNRSW